MKVRLGAMLLVTGFALAGLAVGADDVKSGPSDKTGGPFQVKAITGDNKGKQLCYV